MIRNPRLKRAGQRKIGPIRAGTGTQTLAERIFQRYRLRRLPERSAGLDYLQPAGLTSMPKAVSLAFSLVQRIRRGGNVRVFSLASRFGPQSALLTAAMPQTPARLVILRPQAGGIQVIERILSSHQRLELLANGAPNLNGLASPGLPGDNPIARPAPLIVRQNPPAAALDAAPDRAPKLRPVIQSTELSSYSPAPAGTRPAAERESTGLAPAELRQVTEHVIREIDQRIVANRERLGRS